MDTNQTFSALLVAAMIVWIWFASRATLGDKAEKVFSALSVHSEDPRLCFRGATATVVFQRVDFDVFSRTGSGYCLFRICKNEHGEYFLVTYCADWVPDPARPYVSHLSRERARLALKVDRKAYEREFGSASDN